jgi:hypothetical protein
VQYVRPLQHVQPVPNLLAGDCAQRLRLRLRRRRRDRRRDDASRTDDFPGRRGDYSIAPIKLIAKALLGVLSSTTYRGLVAPS